MEHEVGQKGVVEIEQLYLAQNLTLKFMSKIGVWFSIMKQLFKDMYK